MAFADEAGDLRVSRLEDIGWQTELVPDADGMVDEVSLAFDGSGGLHVAFVESGVLRVTARRSGASGWEVPVVLGEGAAAAVVRAGGGVVHVVWLRGEPGGRGVVWARRP